MYDKKLKEYKEKQENLLLRMEEHNRADEDFCITALTVLDLASRALEIFQSSGVNEKRALLNFLLQNPVLNGRKLLFKMKNPFDIIAQHSKTETSEEFLICHCKESSFSCYCEQSEAILVVP